MIKPSLQLNIATQRAMEGLLQDRMNNPTKRPPPPQKKKKKNIRRKLKTWHHGKSFLSQSCQIIPGMLWNG